jgi:hypothetical protein
MGWLLIAAGVVLAAVALRIIVKHDFDKIEGFHFAAKTDDDNKLAALGLMVCVGGAYALFHFGGRLI